VALTSESDVVTQMEEVLGKLAEDRGLLHQLRQKGMIYAREHLTWEAKARATTEVLYWVLRKAPKPDFVPPKMLHLEYLS
jgi:hypothetical protein